MRQVERENYTENVKGLAQWAQARAKTLRMRERYNEQAGSEEKSVPQLRRAPKTSQRYQTMHIETDAKPQQRKCALCSKEHPEVKCPTLLAASVEQRWDLVKAKKVCFGCLRGAHMRRQCTRFSKCGVDGCDKGHNYLLHCSTPSQPTTASSGGSRNQHSEEPSQGNKGLHCGKAQARVPSTNKVALKTVVVPFVCDSGQVIMGLVLLDSGSETTLIRTGFANQLGISGPKANLTVDTVGGVSTTVKSQRVRLPIASSVAKETVGAWTIKTICAPLQGFDWQEIKQHHTHLHDVPIGTTGEGTVDVLLGLDAAALTIPLEVRRGEATEPVAEKTPLGWVISGPVGASSSSGARVLRAHASDVENDTNHQLRSFWDVDTFGVRVEDTPMYSRNEQRAMEILRETCRPVDSGYELGLLWKQNRPPLPNNYNTALKRLESVERRLQRDPSLAQGYSTAIGAYVKKGFARKLTGVEKTEQWFLPHHPVLSPHKPLPRVVFDSAAVHEGVCLNDCLEAGPSLHNDLPGILMRFRERPIALVGDVFDMFCHVQLRPEDCKYHRYLWRDMETDKPPDIYEMKCLVFGDKSSPCKANYAVKRTAEDNKERFPDAAAVVGRDIFVDDLYTSCETMEQAATLRKNVTTLMAKGGFPMRKWNSSSPEVLATVPEEDRAVPNRALEMGELPAGRALGVKWDPQSDTLGFTSAHIDRPPASGTKRGILKKLAGLYDPLGWASPYVIRAKIMLQRTWPRGLDRDDLLPPDLRTEWNNWENEIAALKSFCVPRFIYRKPSENWRKLLVVFCDASEDACAAAVYMRTKSTSGDIVCHLVIAKTRLMPLKAISIPRGELMACQLAARLTKTTCRELELSMQSVIYLSDSTTALWWIHGEPRNYRPFVANRVAEVLTESDPNQWHHVRTELNIADIATRGVPASEIQAQSTWIQGPEFLRLPVHDWPIDDVPTSAPSTEKAELRKKILRVQNESFQPLVDPATYSSWLRLCRVTAWIRRFCNNLHNSAQPKSGTLSVEELKEAELYWIKWAQKDRFADELTSLSKGRPVSRTSRVASLDPQLVRGVLHVGGRIDRAELPWVSRHPIILDHGHEITRLIVADYHRKLLHAGVEHVFNHLRERFWVLRGRAEVKNCTVKCPLCHRRRVKPMNQKMSELPAVRLAGVSSPFKHVGLDYAGPFQVRIGRNRIEKRYICLFTCLHMRAVHLEVAHSLEADSFIMALCRFQARRGNPVRIYSDNGTNFVGAERKLREELEKMDQEQVTDQLSARGVDWHFNPPDAPWFGGAWEALVKSSKRAMRVMLGNVLTVDEVFLTVIAEVESLLNSCPLVYGGSATSPTDVSALTPNHFLHGCASINFSPAEVTERDMLLRRRWRHSQFLADQF